ncbi:mucoidy inhibitor MuiA family protein [Rhodopirellula sp. MGV]|uniref:mucoidy inhibitor MuiA family protein n=1 Tax=Rhodopirellula sp. MGV TaxID=2023130 RepID=UPI0013047143|nr:mucoidy inhibitor MuiA family protein [Rhodopirellula sp. MGV]
MRNKIRWTRCVYWLCMMVCWMEPKATEGANDFVDVQSRVASVAVFQREANVVREADLRASEKHQRIRLTGLPETLRDQSVRCESDPNLIVRSLSLIPHQDTEVKGVFQEQAEVLRSLQEAVASAKQDVLVIEQDLKTIETLVQFSAAKTNADLNSAKLDTKGVTEIADFVMQRRRALAKELHEATARATTQQEKLETKIAEFAELAGPQSRNTYDVILDVLAPQGGKLRLNYWVDEVSWQPNYTIHATSNPQGEDQFLIEMEGKVLQNSGEDWTGVELVLCTGTPNLNADGPVLAPLRVSASGSSDQNNDPFGRPAVTQPLSAWDNFDDWNDDLQINSEAARKQLAEFNQPQTKQRELAGDAMQTISDETYEIGGSIDIASQAGMQSITILRSTVQSKMYRVVIPLLSTFAYREAELENQTGRNLVGGAASVFLDGQFVGRTDLLSTAAGGEILIGLGADRQVRTRRELLDRNVSIKGGNRLAALNYRLVVSNFHDQPIAIRLMDRLPISNSAGVINVNVDPDTLGKLSTDGKYLRLMRPTGILRWDLEIPPRRFGSDAYDHDYQYSIEMDRTRTIVSTNLQQELKQDLDFQRASGGGMGGGMGGMGGSFSPGK